MMERIVALAPETFSVKEDETYKERNSQQIAMKPIKLLDGFGNFMDEIPNSASISDNFTISPTRVNPAGFYGDAFYKRAIQPIGPMERIEHINVLSNSIPIQSLSTGIEIDLRGYFLIIILILFLLDGVVSQGIKNSLSKMQLYIL